MYFEALDMHRSVIAVKSLEHESDAGFLFYQFIWTGTNRLLQEPVSANLPVIICRNNPTSPTHIRRAKQDRKIQERRREFKADRTPVDWRYGLRLLMQQRGGSACIVFITPLDVFRGNRPTVLEFYAVTQSERRAERVISEIE